MRVKRASSGGAAFLVVAIFLALTACGNPAPAASGSSATSIDALIAQSKKENNLVIYGNPPTDAFKPVLDAFKKTYPWITVQDNDLDDKTVFSKTTAEQAQGSATADLLIASDPAGWVNAAKNRLLTTDFTPAGLSSFPSWANQGNGVFVMSPEPTILIYNTRVISASQRPHSLSDVASLAQTAGLKGKIVTYPMDNALGYAATWAYTTQKGAAAWSTLEKIGPAAKTELEGQSQGQGLVQGTYGVDFFASGLFRGFIPSTKGLLEWTYATDFTPLVPRGMGVTRKAANRASAELFMSFVFSQAGQDALCGSGFTAYMNDYQSSTCQNSVAAITKTVPKENVYLVPFSSRLISDKASLVARWNKAFGIT